MGTELKEIDLKQCFISLVDGTTPTANTLLLKIDEGNLSFTVARNLESKKDRGILDYIKEGDEENMKVSLTCRFAAIISSTGENIVPFEFFTKTGLAASFVSTDVGCSAHCVDIVVKRIGSCIGTLQEQITFPKFAYEQIDGSFRDGTLQVSGMCNAKLPVSVRTAITQP